MLEFLATLFGLGDAIFAVLGVILLTLYCLNR